MIYPPMEPDVRGVLAWTIFLSKGPGPVRQVPCQNGGRVFDMVSECRLILCPAASSGATPPPPPPRGLPPFFYLFVLGPLASGKTSSKNVPPPPGKQQHAKARPVRSNKPPNAQQQGPQFSVLQAVLGTLIDPHKLVEARPSARKKKTKHNAPGIWQNLHLSSEPTVHIIPLA